MMEANPTIDSKDLSTASSSSQKTPDATKERKARKVKAGYQPYAPKKTSKGSQPTPSFQDERIPSPDKKQLVQKLSSAERPDVRQDKGSHVHNKKIDKESKRVSHSAGKKSVKRTQSHEKYVPSTDSDTSSSPSSKASLNPIDIAAETARGCIDVSQDEKKTAMDSPKSIIVTPSNVNCSPEYSLSNTPSGVSTETSDLDDSSVADANDTMVTGGSDISINNNNRNETVETLVDSKKPTGPEAIETISDIADRREGNGEMREKAVAQFYRSAAEKKSSKIMNKNAKSKNKELYTPSSRKDSYDNENNDVEYKYTKPEKDVKPSRHNSRKKTNLSRESSGEKTFDKEETTKRKPCVHFVDVDEEKTIPKTYKPPPPPGVSLQDIKSEISQIQGQLKDLLDVGFTSVEIVADVINGASKLQDLYLEIIINHQMDAFKMDAEGCLWRNGFHNIISGFRNHIEKQTSSNSFSQFICSRFWTYLQNSDLFLENVITLLQTTFKFNLEVYCSEVYKAPPSSKQIKLALRSCHLINLNLGDIERYVTDLRQDGNYTKAIVKYKQAIRLAPKNGKSYNQLAVVSVLTRHKLDAVYYYVRSLDASNSIQSARDRLTLIFHDIKRKAIRYSQERIATELSKKAEMAMILSRQNEFHMFVENDHTRDEFWEFSTQGRRQKFVITRDGHVVPLIQAKDVDQRQSEIDKRSLSDINRAFVIHYLFVHCKLYTRIGLDTFLDDHSETLNELQVLVKQPLASALKRESLIKYMAINMFSVNNLFQKQEDPSSILPNGPLDLAIIFSMEMVQHLMTACLEPLKDHSTQDVCHQFLPAVHVWLKWMLQHLSLLNMSSLMSIVDCWESYAGFLNTACCKEENKEEEDNATDIPPMLLYEDVLLAGMKMLSTAEILTFQGHPETMVIDECKARIKQIVDVAKEIAATKMLPIQYNEESQQFTVAAPDVVTSSPTKNVIPELEDTDVSLFEIDENLQDDSNDVIIEDTDIIDEQGMTNAVLELKARKQQVEFQLKEQQRLLQDRKQLIENNAMQAKVIFCNKPQYVVMDTNCFISALNLVNVVVRSQQFGIIIPLIVVNELDGLKSGLFVDGAPTDKRVVSQVQECARHALTFLEDCFISSRYSIKAVTNQGTELSTIAFRNETFSSDRGNNDDVILNCCMKYCENEKRKQATQGEQLVVERKLVLLTDDKNLRLKAHRCKVPTTGIGIFAHMSMGFV